MSKNKTTSIENGGSFVFGPQSNKPWMTSFDSEFTDRQKKTHTNTHTH